MATPLTPSPPVPPRLILICGLPGAGKTTLARSLQDQVPALRLCPDEWIAALDFPLHDEPRRALLESLFWQITQTLLTHGQSVILEFGFWDRSERDEKRLVARNLGARVELHYLQAPLDELWRRLEIRNLQGLPGTGAITRSQLESWSLLFQPPTDSELSLFDAAYSSSLS